MSGALDVWAPMAENLGERQTDGPTERWDGWRHQAAWAGASRGLQHLLTHPIEDRFLGPGVIREGFEEEADAGFGVVAAGGCD